MRRWAGFLTDRAVERCVLVDRIAARIEIAVRLRIDDARYAARVVGMVALTDIGISFEVRRERVGERQLRVDQGTRRLAGVLE